MVDDHDRHPLLVGRPDGHCHSTLVLEFNRSRLVEGADGSERLAHAFRDLLVQPSPFASFVVARGVARLHLDRGRPRANHDDGVAELAVGRPSPLQRWPEDEVAQAPVGGRTAGHRFRRPAAIHVLGQEGGWPDTANENAFRRFDLEL